MPPRFKIDGEVLLNEKTGLAIITALANVGWEFPGHTSVDDVA